MTQTKTPEPRSPRARAPMFLCGTRHLCAFKNQFVNQRCFATYSVRQSCRYIRREDGKTWANGSAEEKVKEFERGGRRHG